MPTPRVCDPDKLFESVQAQLLRGCRPAVRRLTRAARGRCDFRNELELRACLGLARLVADLLYGRVRQPSAPSDDPSLRELKQLVRFAKRTL